MAQAIRWFDAPTKHRASDRHAPARSRHADSGMIRSAAATTNCAAVVTASSHQSARDNRRTIAPATASRADPGLWFGLVFPSSFIVLKFLGWESTIAYAIGVGLIVAVMPRLPDRLSKRGVWSAAAASRDC
jgi:hypothetical protein